MSENDSTQSTSGGVSLGEGSQITLGAGDVVARDKIVNNIQTIVQRALTAAEQAKQAEAFERQKLAQGVSARVGRVQAIASDESDSDQPYQGLREYRLSHAENFFGRERAIGELWQALADGPLTLLHGEPGVGKTSLLLSRFASRLIAAGHLSIYLRADATDPVPHLKRGFLPDLDQTRSLAAAPLREFLRQVTEVIGADTTLCIFIDAFDLFWAANDEASRAGFTEQLADCLDDNSLNVRWVLVVRSEHFESLSGLRPRIRNPFANTYELRRPSRSEAQAIITAPLARLGFKIEEGLTETLLDELSKTGLALPQIQIVGEGLFKALGQDEKTITRAHYDKLGGVDGLLRRHQVGTLTQHLPPAIRPVARRLLDGLGSTGQRREQIDAPDEVLAQLVDTYLVRARMTEAGLTYESTLSPLAVEPESERPLGSLETLRVLGKAAPRVQPQQTEAAAPSVEVTATQTVEYRQAATSVAEGGIRLGAGASITVGAGDVVGRDKIINNIQNIYQRALSAAEQAKQAEAFERQKLAQGVGAFVGRLQAIASDESDTRDANPYKGLLEYRLSDSEIFFGRSQAIRELLAGVRRGALTVLHSESGSGKTSLLQAGLSPHLIADGHLPLYLRPYNADPALVIKRAFLADPRQAPTLATAPLRDFLFKVCEVLGPETGLYILLDQFEEMFTQQDEAARAEFVRELAECLNDETLNVRWVLALRTEHFGNLANFRPTIRNPYENDYRLNRLTRAEAQEVIVTPAARREVQFESGLVEAILDDLGKTEIAPPQMQLVCASLFNDLNGGRLITHAAYEGEGRAAGILRGHLERVLSRDLPKGSRAAARRLLESLISSEQQRVVRQHQELVQEMGAGGVTATTLNTILSQLVDSHLIRENETENGPVYELAHDYLLGEIKLDPAVQARKAAQEMLEQELRAYRRYKTLLTAERLAVIEPYRAELQLTPEAEELLRLSKAEVEREAAEREATRQRELEAAKKLAETESRRAEEQANANARLKTRNRVITGAVIVAAILALAAGVFAVTSTLNAQRADQNAQEAEANLVIAEAESNSRATAQVLADNNAATAQAESVVRATAQADAEREARIAISGELAAEADALLSDDDPLTAGPIAVEALQVADTAAAQGVLAQLPYHYPAIDKILNEHSAGVNAVAWSPDGKLLASDGQDGVVVIWDAASDELVTTLTVPDNRWSPSLAWSPDGGQVAAAIIGGGVIWDVASGEVAQILQNSTSVTRDIAWSPDGSRLASASDDGTITIWDAASGAELARLSDDRGWPFWSVAWHPDENLLASGAQDGVVLVWNLATGQATPTPGNTRLVYDVAWSPDGAQLASSSWDTFIAIWNRETGETRTLEGHSGNVYGVTWSPDGAQLASASLDRTVIVWDAASGKPKATLAGHTGTVYGVHWRPDGGEIASGSQDGAVILWNARGQLARTLRGHLAPINGLAYSPDGRRLASGGADDTVIIWDMATGQPILANDYRSTIFAVAWDPTGTYVAAALDRGGITIWDTENDEQLGELPGHTASARSVAWSPDGRKLASGGDDATVIIWDAETGEPLTMKGHTAGVRTVAWSPDGAQLASGSDDATIILWDSGGQVMNTLQATAPIWSLAWDKDGRRLASGLEDGTIIIWDAASGQSIATLEGREAPPPISSLAWSPDGAMLASANSFDADILVWDAANRMILTTLRGHKGHVAALAWSPDGASLASGGEDRLIQVVRTETIHPPCEWLARNLTLTESVIYFGDEDHARTCENLAEGE
jgi:WD40 repeat protein